MFAMVTGALAALATYLSIPLAVTLTLGSINAYLNRAFARALAVELVHPRAQWALTAMARRNAGKKAAVRSCQLCVRSLTRAKWMVSLVNLEPGASVLDLGSKGSLLPALARRIMPAGRVHVVEGTSAALQLSAGRDAEALGDGAVALLEHSADSELPLDADQFDAVFAVEQLQSVEPAARQQVVCEWARLVKPGGRLVVVCAGELDPVLQAGLLARTYHSLSAYQCVQLLLAAGLGDVQWRVQDREDDALLVACVGTKPMPRQSPRGSHGDDDKAWEPN